MQKNGKQIFLFLSLLAVVAVSGCISSLGFGGGETVVEASNDVMIFSDSTVIPNPPILTDDTFTTSFNIKNLDEFEDAKNAKLELYDWGVCEPTSTCAPTKGVYTRDIGAVSPKDVQNVECQFKSPSSEKIGGLDAKCPIRYKLSYGFSGETTTELNVISNQKFRDMQRAGQAPSISTVQTKSRGPIKVDFSFGVNQPARTSSTGNAVKIPMYVTVENKGSGKIVGSATTSTAKVSTVATQPQTPSSTSLKITIPANFTSNGKTDTCKDITCGEFFDGVPQEITDESGKKVQTGNCMLTLKADKKIEFVKDKSQVFRCELTSPADSADFEQKTFSIQSDVEYTYQLDNDFSVAIKPMTIG